MRFEDDQLAGEIGRGNLSRGLGTEGAHRLAPAYRSARRYVVALQLSRNHNHVSTLFHIYVMPSCRGKRILVLGLPL